VTLRPQVASFFFACGLFMDIKEEFRLIELSTLSQTNCAGVREKIGKLSLRSCDFPGLEKSKQQPSRSQNF